MMQIEVNKCEPGTPAGDQGLWIVKIVSDDRTTMTLFNTQEDADEYIKRGSWKAYA